MNIRESLFRALDSLNEASIIHNGKKYSNVKRFDDDKSANDFIEKNPGHGVLHADRGGVYVTHNKNKGVKHTYTAHNEETEHLDEISKDLAARAYRGFTAKGDEAYADKSPEGNKKYIETQIGRKAAIDKFHGNSKVPATGPRPANEETEHLDEVSDKKWDESKEKWVTVKRPTFDPKKERGRASTPDQGQKRSDFDEETAPKKTAAQLKKERMDAVIIQNQKNSTERNASVGNIESRVVPIFPVKQQEIHDMTIRDPVDHVAQRATQDKC
jgi:hypothetical protein